MLLSALLLGLALMFAPSTVQADQVYACNTGGYHCYSLNTQPVREYFVTFQAGRNYVVATSNLGLLPSSNYTAVDSVIWVLNLDASEVVAIDDDGNSATGPGTPFWDKDSRVTFTPTTTFQGRVLVASRTPFTEGIADVSVLQDGTELLPSFSAIDVPFGGWSRVSDVRTGDRLYLGAAYGDNQNYWNTLYLFRNTSYSCTSNCGAFRSAHGPLPSGPVRHVDGLSFIPSSWTDSTTLVLGGSGLNSSSVNTRLLHVRVHEDDGGRWSGDAYLDQDSDGLTWQLEEALGTCDDDTGPSPNCVVCESGFSPTCPAGQCLCFGDRHPKHPGATAPYDMSDTDFDASDSDHDGISDFEEVFGRSLLCPAGLTPALSMPPATSCTNISVHGCPSPLLCSPRAQVPFSALGAWPSDYDVYVESDSLGTSSASELMGSALLYDVRHIYGTEGLECPEVATRQSFYCPGQLDWHYRIDLHVYEGTVVGDPVPEANWTWGQSFARSHVMHSFTYTRRMQNIFRYAVGITRGGQAQGGGRRFVYSSFAPVPNATRAAVFPHELGHTLGLSHGGFEGKNGKLNYPSLMNYRYDYQGIQKPSALAGTFLEPWPLGVGCASDAQCSPSAICGSGQCRANCGNATSAVTGRHIRFSRGDHASLDEAALLEQIGAGSMPSRRYAAQVACAGAGPTFCSCAPAPPPPQCVGNTSPGAPATDWDSANGPWVDYDQDSIRDGALVASPVNGNNNTDCGVDADVRDNNDWMQMYREGRTAGSLEPDGGAIIYFSRMEGSAADSWTGFPSVLAAPNPLVGSTSFAPGYLSWGAALQVANTAAPFNQSYLSLISAPQWESMGTTVEGRAPEGLSVRLQFRLDSFTHGLGHTLIANDLFRVEVPNASRRVHLWLHNGLSWGLALAHPTVLQQGVWYQLAFRWRRDGELINGSMVYGAVDVAPEDPTQPGQFYSQPNRVCRRHTRRAVSERPVGPTRVGAGFVNNWGLNGMIDHLAVKNYDEKEWHLDYDNCP